MIISKPKGLSKILQNLKEESIFIIGCGKCAAKLRVGGEPEVLEMEKKLLSSGKKVLGSTVLSTACTIKSIEDILSENPGMERSDAFLVMSCGGGVSVISRFARVPVYPALDTESLGGVYEGEIVKEQCGMCGECTVWMSGGICPVINCAKGLLNGPCGGAFKGKCEVDERTCAWDEIFEKLKKLGKLEYLEIIPHPKDHSKRRRQKI